MSKRLLLPFLGLIILSAFFSCRKDDFSSDPNYKLEFSQDTVMFDTVFTSVGSSTEVFTVYNNNPDPIKISSLRLESGSSSSYRLNVDGVSGKIIL
ncbi:MAG: hypothetical protein IPP51_11150 [Bacteroidetes bacterium]|nr:hypothetical protein [Bacteroidota bacterium]